MNILVIDDEDLILKNVCAKLQELDLKVDLIDMAHSAAEAREKLKDQNYELFLCDIVMPEEDGISFGRWAVQQYPHSKVVFLTAYADFTYVKEAIAMQSFDYILQPVKNEELKNVVERAIAQISIEQKNRRLIQKGTYFEDREIELTEGAARRYLSGFTEDDSYLKRRLSLEQIEADRGESYFPVRIQVLEKSSSWNDIPEGLLRSIHTNIVREITEPLKVKSLLFLRGNSSDEFVILFYIEPGRNVETENITNCLENMRVVYEKTAGITTAVFCGGFCSYPQLRDVCMELDDEILDNVKKVSKVYRIGQLSSLNAVGYSFESELASWKSLVNQQRLADLKISVFNYIDFYTSGNDVNRDYLMKIHQSISELVLGFMSNNDIDSTIVFDRNMSYYDFVYSWNSVNSLKKAIGYVLDRLCDIVDMPDDDKVRSTIRYIRQNISEDISVNELADRVNMNPGYFTRLFKKNTGMSLKRFIIIEKIEAAKILLTTTNLAVSVISGQVGYASYSNFTHSFKLVTGLTPSEYQRQMGKDSTDDMENKTETQ